MARRGRRGKGDKGLGDLPPPPPPELMLDDLPPPPDLPKTAGTDAASIPLPSGSPPAKGFTSQGAAAADEVADGGSRRLTGQGNAIPSRVAMPRIAGHEIEDDEEVVVDVEVMDDLMDSLEGRRRLSSEQAYDELWKRRSRKPLQQMYGHIDRLAAGEVGSLLERYADRFGHELDRELIVKRRADREAALAALREGPVVELIEDEPAPEPVAQVSVPAAQPEVSAPAAQAEPELFDLDPDIEDLLEDELERLEARIAPTRKKIELHQKRNQRSAVEKQEAKIADELDAIDAIEAVLDGEEPLEVLVDYVPIIAQMFAPEPEPEPEPAPTPATPDGSVIPDDPNAAFAAYVGFCDDALGKLPEEAMEALINSSDFDVYRGVAMSPGEASDAQRRAFVALVDTQLGLLPEAEVDRLVSSPDFALYREVTTRYS